MSGQGTIHSFTVNHQQWVAGTEPYVIVLVELDEQVGLRITANLRDLDPAQSVDVDAVAIGLRVQVCFEQLGELFIPQFSPVAS